MMANIFSYEGKRVAIVGCFSGMGEACARELVKLGAEVHGADIKPSPVDMASFTQIDLKDWASIDKAVASIGGQIDALFNCAGLPQTFPAADVVGVNFLGIRHWTEQWLPRMGKGGAIATISSLAGMAYPMKLEMLKKVIAISDRAEFTAWIAANPEPVGDGYSFSKELLNTWTCLQAVELAPRGIRINATMPSPTQTPMMADFEKIAGAVVLDTFTAPTGRRSTPEEQGNPMVLLNSDAASFISGVVLPVDGGFHGGVTVGAIDVQALLARATAPVAA
jgi:NAD(P)-dependent dehydrogenase (short-subunit alcohol dehydrogenase family)